MRDFEELKPGLQAVSCIPTKGHLDERMSKRNILLHPDPRLKKTCVSVSEFDSKLKTLADDMLETMYAAPGIGLAAPQIGVDARMLVMDCAAREEDDAGPVDPKVLINPEITWFSEETGVYEEGCLSIPDIYAEVTRPLRVKVGFLDLSGNTVEEEYDGLWATCVQHEIDHLNGKLFIDYLSSVKRTMITNKMKKLKKERGRA